MENIGVSRIFYNSSIIILIASVVAEKGNLLWGLLLLNIYSIGHSILLLVAGTSLGFVKNNLQLNVLASSIWYLNRNGITYLIDWTIYVLFRILKERSLYNDNISRLFFREYAILNLPSVRLQKRRYPELLAQFPSE